MSSSSSSSSSSISSSSSLLGFPRFGSDRQLKTALESYWNHQSSANDLLEVAKGLRADHWKLIKEKGIDIIPSNDFSLYDHVLDTAVLFNVIPKRHRDYINNVINNNNNANNNATTINPALLTYFSMARGAVSTPSVSGVSACEMKKWFDTNYHYIVPEYEKNQLFSLNTNNDSIKAFVEFNEAKAIGINTRPVLLGPISFLLLGKWEHENVIDNNNNNNNNNPLDLLSLLDSLLPCYVQLLSLLKSAGASSIQIDEPILVTDVIDEKSFDQYYRSVYSSLSQTGLDIVLTTYFGHVGNNVAGLLSLPVKGVHFDLVRGGPKEAPAAYQLLIDTINAMNNNNKKLPEILSLGVINGRNIWKANIREIIETIITPIRNAIRNNNTNNHHTTLHISTSCSLLHTPHSLAAETKMDPTIRSWLSFATEKLSELVIINKGINQGVEAIENEIKESDSIVTSRSTSPLVYNAEVRARLSAVTPSMLQRSSPHSLRNSIQQKTLNLPLFPTTTIGSFPQTAELRKVRSQYRSGKISEAEYDSFIRSTIKSNIDIQESIGLDVFVHGEPERTDMVEFFGELLSGFIFTQYGWVQSYGSRCVKPPIICGDVIRTKPMTVELAKYSQSLTSKPVKGMLTAPTTILQWSFVRDDQARSLTAQQIALVIRDEVADLEKAGIHVIQLDEPAIREGLPLRKSEWTDYLSWSVNAFLLSSCGVSDGTQIHTHMCYSDFQDIFAGIVRMDADVITIENARSDLKLLSAFKSIVYPNRIAPGLYDIHSPRVPTAQEMLVRASTLLKFISPNQLEIVPDCGLKTRKWEEVVPALQNLVAVAKALREQYEKK